MIKQSTEKELQKREGINPALDQAGILAQLLHSSYARVVEKGNQEPYQTEMLFEIPLDLSLTHIAKNSKSLTNDLSRAGRLTIPAIIKSTSRYFTLTLIFFTLSSTCSLTLPYTLKLFIAWLETKKPSAAHGAGLIVTFCLLIFLRGIISARANEYFYKVLLQSWNTLSWISIQKIFELDPRAAFYVGYGKIAVLINSDVDKLSSSISCLTYVYQIVFQFLVTILILYQLIGAWLTLLTVFTIFVILVIQKQIFKRFRPIDEARRTNIDSRSQLSNEMITGIKNIKFTASETVIERKLNQIRQNERNQLLEMFNRVGVNLALSWNISPITAFVIFGLNKVFGGELETGTIFATIMYLGRLSYSTNFLIDSYTIFTTALVSLKRLGGLLGVSERRLRARRQRSLGADAERMAVGEILVKNFDASWEDFELRDQVEKISETGDRPESKGLDKEEHEEELLLDDDQGVNDSSKEIEGGPQYGQELSQLPKSEKLVLKDINLNIKPGQFVVILGSVGSGKSSLLRAIINELNPHQGHVLAKGRIAMVTQQAFLLNETLRGNILFGKEFNQQKYNKVVEICQLRPDLETLPSGDLTEIGERGVNLSGGQKQRVSLARAVYSESDIYLIDDCLSALDAHAGQSVLDDVILGHLRGKTVVMASHHTHFLERANSIFVLNQGKIAFSGRFEELRQREELKFMFLGNSKSENFRLKNTAKSSTEGQKNQTEIELVKKKLKNHNNNQAEDRNRGKLTIEEQRSIGIITRK